ncbi:MAG: hypothetical protein J6575_03470 [Bifidobacterium sp.]|nr:hypothetical protein [Bifidobacterium sp.]
MNETQDAETTATENTNATASEQNPTQAGEETGKHAGAPKEQTLQDVIDANPVLDGLPALEQPNRLLPRQTAGLINTMAGVRDALKQGRDAVGTDDETRTTMAVNAWVLENGCAWLQTIALKPAEFEEWTRGKEPLTLAQAALNLMLFYEDELGKSLSSPTATSDAR